MTLQSFIVGSWGECRGLKDRWNSLWARSTTAHPTGRFEFVDQWIQRFAPQSRTRTIVVEEGSELVAVLPLVETKWRGVLTVGALPRNDWLCPGTFLIDPNADVTSAMRLIVNVLDRQPWRLHRWPLLPGNDFGWAELRNTFISAGRPFVPRHIYDVAWVKVAGDWESYLRSLSKNHRKTLGRIGRRMEEQGGYRMARFTPASMEDAGPLLEEVLHIEQASWKGRAGTSMADAAGMADFLRCTAATLIANQELEIAFLELDGQRIAFELLWNAKGVLASYKVGYLSGYEALMPGQMLMQELLRELFETHRCEAYDCLGPASTATLKWATHLYSVENWTIAGKGMLGRWMAQGYQRWSEHKQSQHAEGCRLRPCAREVTKEVQESPVLAGTY